MKLKHSANCTKGALDRGAHSIPIYSNNLFQTIYSKQFISNNFPIKSFLSISPEQLHGNNAHNQVINQLSILNQPSRSSELEPFRQPSVLSSGGAEIAANGPSRTNGFDIETRRGSKNAEHRSEGHEDRSLNGNLNAVPLHRLMSKDEIQLFLSPHNDEEISRSDPQSPPIKPNGSNSPLIRNASPSNSSDAKNSRATEQLANQSTQDDRLSNKYANEQISDNQADPSLETGKEGKVFFLSLSDSPIDGIS